MAYPMTNSLLSVIRFFTKLSGTIVMIVLGYFALTFTAQIWDHGQDPAWLSQFVAQTSPYTLALLYSCFIVLMSIGFPRQAIAFFCGAGLGSSIGTLVALTLTAVSASITYTLAKGPLRVFAIRALGKKLCTAQVFVSRSSFRNVLIARLFPIGSNLVTNLLAGVLQLPFPTFFFASLLGFLPQTVLFSLLGSGIDNIPYLQQVLPVGGLIICIGLVVSLPGIKSKAKQ